jgi:hypothetical protein
MVLVCLLPPSPFIFKNDSSILSLQTETLEENSSEFSVYGTFISAGKAYQGRCSAIGSLLECVHTYYNDGIAYSTLDTEYSPEYLTTTLPATTTSPYTTTPPTPTQSASSSSKGAIIGGVVGSLVLILVLLAIFLFYRRRRQTNAVVNANAQPDASMMERPLPQTPAAQTIPQELYRSSYQLAGSPTYVLSEANPYDVPAADTRSNVVSTSTEKSYHLSPVPASLGLATRTDDPSRSMSWHGGILPGPSYEGSPTPASGPPSTQIERPFSTSDVSAGSGAGLAPQVEALRAEVERLQRMVVPEDAPPEYDA